jgi:hypothetical protein
VSGLDAAALIGRWKLTSWHNSIGGQLSYPLGRAPQGVLIYTPDGWMAVQITAPDRHAIDTMDPLGGSEPERATAYATSLAYCGRYEVEDDRVVHEVELCSFPNWAGQQQVRLVELDGDELVLRTAPVQTRIGVISSELRWARAA